MDASHVYVGALVLGCFYSHISTQTFRRVLTASVDSCAEIKSGYSFSGVTKSGRVWRRVPESDARSVGTILLNKVQRSALFFLPVSSYLQLAVSVCQTTSVSSFKSSLKAFLFFNGTNCVKMTKLVIEYHQKTEIKYCF